jgi:putative FmdB family regulatory protein
MPNYDYRCKVCDHRFEEFQLIKDRKKPCKSPCPSCGEKMVEQFVSSAPVLIDPVRLGVRRPDSGFKEVISKIKAAHPRSGMKDY